jgi:hypothetical protein
VVVEHYVKISPSLFGLLAAAAEQAGFHDIQFHQINDEGASW